jgi:hypothetical protein
MADENGGPTPKGIKNGPPGFFGNPVRGLETRREAE